MSKLSFRARALDASKPMPIYLAEELPDLPDYSAINRAVPQMPSGMEKEEECEHHLQRAISGTGLIIPTPEVCQVTDLDFYERCYPPDYKMPKQHIHMQPLWEEQEAPEYDIDSEDERWLRKQRHPELTELLFEQMMDKLEKSSGQTVATLTEAKLLLERKDDLVIAVYDYWLNKRLTTKRPLILTVKTESRPGQSTNNPYLAFRRRTEKMQTRKNRKNDESSYEKMLKLRRDLARALSLLQLVARREQAKRDLVKLTASLADKRYQAGDFANQLLPEPPPRPVVSVGLASALRREQLMHFPPRPDPAPHDIAPRVREKRPYKRRKHRHHSSAAAQGLRESGVGTSSEEESIRGGAAADASPIDDGPFAFRRKPGCYYEMPTTTLYGDPVDPERTGKDALFEHEIDERHRYTLTSISYPYPLCVGFARRRVCRLGRIALDRVRTPLDDLWPKLPHQHVHSSAYKRERDEEVELETKVHRTPKEMSRDYHSSGKHPWRHAFRQHLSRNPHLWTADVKPDVDDVKLDVDDVKLDVDDVKMDVDDVKIDVEDLKLDVDLKMDVDKSDLPQDSDISIRTVDDLIKNDSESEVKDAQVNYELDKAVRSNLQRVVRKRSWSGCSDTSYDSDESLYPVEKEFESFVNDVNNKWLHFRPKTPPPSPPLTDDHFPVTPDTPLTVELRPAEACDLSDLTPFTTSEFTLSSLLGDVVDPDRSGSSLDVSDDLLDDFTGLTEDQVESILSETDLKGLDGELKDKKIADDILDSLVASERNERSELNERAERDRRRRIRGANRERFGSSSVSVLSNREQIYLEREEPEVKPPLPVTQPKRPVPKVEAAKPTARQTGQSGQTGGTSGQSGQTSGHSGQALQERPKAEPREVREQPRERPLAKPVPSPVPNSRIIVEEVNEVPQQLKLEKKKHDTIEEFQLAHGVQLKTVQTKHSPLKKHIITTGARRSDVTTSHVVTHVTSHASHVASHVTSHPSHVTSHPSHVTSHPSHVTSHANVTHAVTHAVTSHASVSQPESSQPQILTVSVSDSLKVRLQNHLMSSQAGMGSGATVVGLVGNGPFASVALPVPSRDHQTVSVSASTALGLGLSTLSPSRARVSTVSGVSSVGTVNVGQVAQVGVSGGVTPLVQLAPALHKPSQPVVVAQSHTIHHVAPNKLKVLHAHPLTQTQRSQLLAQNRNLSQLPAVVSLATLGEAKAGNAALLKAAPGVTQFFEIKGGQLGKGPHLVNVVRQPQAVKTPVARLELSDAKKRQVVATFDGSALKGNIQTITRPHRVNVNLETRAIVRAALPAGVRAPHVRHQIQLKNRAFQVATGRPDPPASITVAATKTTAIPSSVVANLLQKNVQIPKGGQKISISSGGVPGMNVGVAGVSALSFGAGQIKARQARLLAPPRPQPRTEIVEASTAPTASTSSEGLEDGDETATNGVRRRANDTLPMEVT